MENKLNDLLGKLNESINNEDQLLKFFSSRLVSEIGSLLNRYQIIYKSYELQELSERYIYYSCKIRQNDYINRISLIHNELSSFLKVAEKEGTNSLECDEQSKNYNEKIQEVNSDVTYENEFSNFKNNVMNIIGLDNQQLDSELNGILNNNRLELETGIMKIRKENSKKFNEIRDAIKTYGTINNRKKINPKTQMEIVRDNLVSINNKKEQLVRQKAKESFDYGIKELENSLGNILKNFGNNDSLMPMISNLFMSQFNVEFPLFYEKINTTFINYLVDRVSEELPKNLKFEISRDRKTFEFAKKFLDEFNMIDLDVVFANIEANLIKNYDLNSGNSMYMKVLNILNTVKSKIENFIKKLENDILLANIIEMQSQILRMNR